MTATLERIPTDFWDKWDATRVADAPPSPVQVTDAPRQRQQRSLGRRALRAFLRVVVTLGIGVGGTLAWQAYGDDAMLARFRSDFGMANLRFVPGFTRSTYWGFVKCTTDDLAALVHHVLTGTDPTDRATLVAALRGVAPNQQWGVWAAGSAQAPGNKDGWSFESDAYGRHWVTDTVGFAGPDERYGVAEMYQVDPAGSLAGGVHAVSDLVALLFGRATPAPVTVPAPDG